MAHQMASSSSRKPRPSKAAACPNKPAVLYAAADFVVTIIWVLFSSLLAEVAEWMAVTSGFKVYEMFFGLALLLMALVMFGPVSSYFDGCFNPVISCVMLSSGKSRQGLWTEIVRMVGQTSGSLVGSYAAIALVPEEYQGKFPFLAGGIKKGVGIEAGFACEMLLCVVLGAAHLFSLDTTNRKAAQLVPLLVTAVLVVGGAPYTGPSMNPAATFSWWWHHRTHTVDEQIAVYWLGPLAGAVLVGLFYRYTFKQTPVKKKKQA